MCSTTSLAFLLEAPRKVLPRTDAREADRGLGEGGREGGGRLLIRYCRYLGQASACYVVVYAAPPTV